LVYLRGAEQKQAFIKEFEYGSSNEGYWNYDHMVLQMEDCINLMTILYPSYDYLFLFDHSCGYDMEREDDPKCGEHVKKLWRKTNFSTANINKRGDRVYLGT
jgi:hypothetical protein